MNELTVKMVVAGLLFGLWPLIMNRSGLTGITSLLVISISVFLLVVPVAFYTGIATTGANWWLAILAGCLATIGMLVFTSGLATATPATVGKLFVVMILVQTAVPAVYHVAVNGGLNLKTAVGFILAILAATLLA